jgi:hypothetical protein
MRRAPERARGVELGQRATAAQVGRVRTDVVVLAIVLTAEVDEQRMAPRARR